MEEADPKDEVAVAVMEVKEGLFDNVICVEVPIKTFCPPLMDRLEPTVKLAKVEVPIPPFETGMTPVMAMVEVPEIWMLPEPVNREEISE